MFHTFSLDSDISFQLIIIVGFMAILNYNAMKGLRIKSQDDQKEHDPCADCDSVTTLFFSECFGFSKI